MNHGSLFSGIGGPDLAAEWMGWNNIFHCEINPFGKQVLNYYWPNSISYDDIKTTDFSIHRGTIDVLTGGFPCQPYSQAGKRLGKEDDRHLWPYMLRAIQQIKPRWIVGENVSGIINWNDGLVFDEVQTQLEAEGYEVQAYVLPAVSVNAPHRRDRVWFIAHSVDRRYSAGRSQVEEKDGIQEIGRQAMGCGEFDRTGISPIITNSQSNGNRGILSGMEGKNDSKRESQKHRENNLQLGNNGEKWNVTNSGNEQLQGSQLNGSIGSKGQVETDGRQFSGSVCSKWEQFPTQPPICSGNDGLPDRLAGITVSKHRGESIKAYGNAIVPQVIHQIFKSIAEYENLYNENSDC
jgi:DNA (cytosine-5)-methyltransferase 1